MDSPILTNRKSVFQSREQSAHLVKKTERSVVVEIEEKYLFYDRNT